jgi:hypothetical protein
MNLLSLRNITIIAGLILLLIITASAQQFPPPLFAPVSSAASPSLLKDPAIIRARRVKLNINAITAINSAADTSVTFNLFNNAKYVGNITSRNQTAGRQTISGSINDEIEGTFTFVVTETEIVGNIHTPDADYEIRPTTNAGILQIQQISSDEPGCDEEAPLKETQSNGMTDTLTGTDDGSIIDTLILYTPAALKEAGGKTKIEDLIALGIQETNDNLTRSGILFQVRVVKISEVTYTSNKYFKTDKKRLQDTNDGYMDIAHSLRDQYKADQVTLLRVAGKCKDGGPCAGTASSLPELKPYTKKRAFSVVGWKFMTRYHTFGHELGHNLGCAHNVGSTSNLFSYSHGWKFRAKKNPRARRSKRYRTILSYGKGTKIPYFSTPNKKYLRVPIGDAVKADNVRTMNQTRKHMAKYRESEKP